jgi:citrate lyase beta subunit
VLVRVNNEPALLRTTSTRVLPGLDGLSIPKVESAAQVEDIVAQIERLERDARRHAAAPAPVAGASRRRAGCWPSRRSRGPAIASPP